MTLDELIARLTELSNEGRFRWMHVVKLQKEKK